VYALLRKNKLVEPGGAEEAARRVRHGLVPILKGRPGFRLHLGFVSETSETVGVTFFDDREPALDAHERVRAWAAEHMRDLTPDEPEVRSGAVLLHRGGSAQALAGGEAALFVTVRQYDSVGAAAEAVSLLTERTLPAIERQPGFRGFWAFRDERDPAHAVSVGVWNGRGAAFAAHQRALEVMAGLRDVFPTPPKITAGAARLVAA
jgi:heme-degrading monooxygenase HmoA